MKILPTRAAAGDNLTVGAELARDRDRADAGRALARRLGRFRGSDALVLGIPRGGLPVAAEVARAIDAELDVVVARRAQRAFTNLAKVEKQAASIEARLKKWREKAAYYEKKGFRPGD